jgi:hypothetical protein
MRLARQALYPLSQALSSRASFYGERGLLFLFFSAGV